MGRSFPALLALLIGSHRVFKLMLFPLDPIASFASRVLHAALLAGDPLLGLPPSHLQVVLLVLDIANRLIVGPLDVALSALHAFRTGCDQWQYSHEPYAINDRLHEQPRL